MADLLGLPSIGVTDDFYHLGADSIVAMQATVRARAAGLGVRPGDLLLHPTIRDLAMAFRDTQAPGPRESAAVAQPETGGVLPMQAWFLEQRLDLASHWNQSLWLCLGDRTELAAVEAVIGAITAAHPALRAEPGTRLVSIIDLGTVPSAYRSHALGRVVEALRSGVDLSGGPLLRALIVDGLDDGRHLLLMAHHFAVDAVSWNVLVEDLNSAYPRVAVGVPAGTSRRRRLSRAVCGESGRVHQDAAGGRGTRVVDRRSRHGPGRDSRRESGRTRY